MVADLVDELPPGAVLVVTADHGQIDVGPHVELLGGDIMSMVRFISGEGRFRWLHARPGAADDLAESLGRALRRHHLGARPGTSSSTRAGSAARSTPG